MSDSDYQTYTTSTSSVTGERNDLTVTHTISARPSIIHVKGKDGTVLFSTAGPRMTSAVDTTFFITGNRFTTKNLTVYLSASEGTYTNYHTLTSEFDLYSTHSSLSSKFPAFSGIELPRVALTETEYTMNYGHYIVSDQTLQLNISGTQASGKIDIIIANKAGYITLNEATTGRIITVGL